MIGFELPAFREALLCMKSELCKREPRLCFDAVEFQACVALVLGPAPSSPCVPSLCRLVCPVLVVPSDAVVPPEISLLVRLLPLVS